MDKELWQSITQYDPDQPGARLPFSARLARENGWTLEYALRVIHEYKKYMYLLCATCEPLTPSEDVDQAWHLHLVYTRQYWDVFCGTVLQRNIHHNPTEGGMAEGEKFENQYSRTLKLYEEHFDKAPPADIWPPAQQRFKETIFTRVNRHRYWLLPKPKPLR